MSLLPRLPDEPFQYKTKMRDALIPRVLKHLTAKRAVAVDRTEFFAHAEAFAALVQMEFVSIPGACHAGIVRAFLLVLALCARHNT